MQFIFCNDNTCCHNLNGVCMKPEIHIGTEQTGVEQGRAKIYSVCRDYAVKGNKDARADRKHDGPG